VTRRLNIVDWLAFAIVIIGGLSWGVVGLFEFNPIASDFVGESAFLTRTIYSVVGFAALYLFYSLIKIASIESGKDEVATTKKVRLKKAS